MNDFGNIIQRVKDYSFIIENGTRHVPHPSTLGNDENAEFYTKLWHEVEEYAKANPSKVTKEFPLFTEEERQRLQKEADAKLERAAAVAAITVTVDGMIFDGDEKAQERMSRTITAATATGASMDDTTTWVLHDNTIATVSIRQLATALRLAGEKQTELWVLPYQN